MVDASRRTTSANAFVTGLGHSKRVVLYDTLIDRFKPGEVRVVVAHELGHVKQHDVRRGMIWVAIVAPPAMFVVMLLDRALVQARRRVTGDGGEPARVRPRSGAGLLRCQCGLEPALATDRGQGRHVRARS